MVGMFIVEIVFAISLRNSAGAIRLELKNIVLSGISAILSEKCWNGLDGGLKIKIFLAP